MNTYIVSYDLSEPGQRYNELLKLIKEEGNWARLGQSAYLVNTYRTAENIRDKLKIVLDTNDRLFVGSVDAPAAWVNLPKEVSDWIHQKLG